MFMFKVFSKIHILRADTPLYNFQNFCLIQDHLWRKTDDVTLKKKVGFLHSKKRTISQLFHNFQIHMVSSGADPGFLDRGFKLAEGVRFVQFV